MYFSRIYSHVSSFCLFAFAFWCESVGIFESVVFIPPKPTSRFFSVSTEGASLACYNFFCSSANRTSTVYGNSVSSQGNQRCSVQCAGVFHCTEAPFQVVNLEREEKNCFFLMCFVLWYIGIPAPLVTYFSDSKNGNFNSFSGSIQRIQGTSFAKKINYLFSVC